MGIADELRAARFLPPGFAIGEITSWGNLNGQYWFAPAGRELVQTKGAAAQKTLAGLAARNGDFVWQSELLEKYTRNNPGDEQAFLDLGNAYVRTSQPQKAAAAFQHVLALNPNSLEAKEALEELRGEATTEKK